MKLIIFPVIIQEIKKHRKTLQILYNSFKIKRVTFYLQVNFGFKNKRVLNWGQYEIFFIQTSFLFITIRAK